MLPGEEIKRDTRSKMKQSICKNFGASFCKFFLKPLGIASSNQSKAIAVLRDMKRSLMNVGLCQT